MKIGVAGSRSIDNKEYVFKILDGATGTHIRPTIISGGASGVDSLAKEYALGKAWDFILFKPYHMLDNKTRFEPKYFFTRNRQIVDNSDLMIIFWDGESNGTRYVINYCKKKGKKYLLYNVE